MENSLVRVERDEHDERIGWVVVNNPPVNSLSPGVPEGISAGVAELDDDPKIKAIILMCEGRSFISGADISQFPKLMKDDNPASFIDELCQHVDAIESSNTPVIAAIHGNALGGGLEVAMACHYRYITRDCKLGQPEVQLGLIPGAGGTQRLPRLVGAMKALEMCITGQPISADEAIKLNLADGMIDAKDINELRISASGFAQALIDDQKPARRTRDINIPESELKLLPQICQQAHKMAEDNPKAKGMLAPFLAIDAIGALATAKDFNQGRIEERDLFVQCLRSPQCAALVHIFFAQRKAPKINWIPKDTPIADINQVGIIGAGTMGGGIAMVFANAGIPVVLKEVNKELMEKGMERIRKEYDKRVKKGKMTQDKMNECMGLISPTTQEEPLADVNLVIEAATENMDLKLEIFKGLSAYCGDNCILATNTSSLDIDQIAQATQRPEQVIGTHFFSPANVMPLLEVVKGSKTNNSVIATVMKLAKKIRKTPVLVANCFGFMGNRILFSYIRAALELVDKGIPVERIDSAIEDFGFAMGPFRMIDMSGLDVSWHVMKAQGDVHRAIDILNIAKRHGQKTKMGFYLYEGTKHKVDPELSTLLGTSYGSADPDSISDSEITDRLVYALVNEGANVLNDGIAQRSSDIDVAYVFGYGFPAYKGGPMHYADQVGLKKVTGLIRAFGWKPSELLLQLLDSSFPDWDQEI